MTAALHTYRAGSDAYDEAVEPDGGWRRGWRQVAAAMPLDPSALVATARQAERLLDAEGSGHLVHEVLGASADTSRPWRLDPFPFVLEADEFHHLAAGVSQRMRLLEQVVADHYRSGSLATAGVVPLGTVAASAASRSAAHGSAPRRWIVHAAFDVVRSSAGEWKVVADDVAAPAGLGYTLLDRNVMARVAGPAMRQLGVAPIHPHLDALRRALTAYAPLGVRSPRCVVLTGGPSHPNYVEHSWLATHLGYHLVEGGDVVMRAGRLWLRALDGLEPLDVVWRGLDDGSLDPLETMGTAPWAGVPGLVWGERRGGVALANAFGAGVLQHPALHAALPALAPMALGESLLLPQSDGHEPLATVPVFDGATVRPGRVTLRLFAVAGNDGISVLPGGGARVLADTDHPAAPTSKRVKDVWVVGLTPASPTLPLRAARPPQVDLATSVPRRAADALFQVGRAAERTEVLVRTMRTVGDRLSRDPGLADDEHGDWSRGVIALLRAARIEPSLDATDGDPEAGAHWIDAVQRELLTTTDAVVRRSGDLLVEAGTVREFLSTTTGRVLGRIADGRHALAHVSAVDLGDTLDTLLVDLAALAGLAVESTVRGPAWRFLDLGRRLERGIAVTSSVEAALGLAVDDAAFQPLSEVLLATNESLVAYRRRYRSDIELGAVLELLLHDDANPRALAYQVDRLREHASSLSWAQGIQLVDAAGRALMVPVSDDVVNGRRWSIDRLVVDTRGPLLELAGAVHQRWFADPVRPVPVRGR